MKKKDYLWSLLAIVMAAALSVSLSSCGDDDDDPEPPTLTVEKTSVSFSAGGGTASIAVNSNTAWSVTGGDNWLTVTKSSNTVNLTASKNESTEEKQTTITVRTDDGSLSQPITVTIEGAELTLDLSGLDAAFPSEAGSLQVAQELTIKCNTKWEISTDANWIVIDALNGNGDKTVKVWMRSENNSTTVRSAILTVTAGSQSKSKTIIQEAGINGNLSVTPNNVVIMSNGFACDWNYGSDVMYYYARMYLSSAIDRQTDAEIIAMMSDDDRDTPGDSYVTSWNLNAQTNYILCTVGYDRNGKSGALTRYPITTKKGTNQALVAISDVWYDDTYWHWTTSINGFVTKYYQWFISRSDLHGATDAAIAWFFQREMKEYPDDFAPIVNGTSWNMVRNGGTIFHLATWAVDVDGNFSGVIDNFAGQINSSSRKTVQKNNQLDSNNLKRYKTIK